MRKLPRSLPKRIYSEDSSLNSVLEVVEYREFQPVLVLSGDEVRSVSRRGIVDAVEEAFKQLALGNVALPERNVFKVPGSGSNYVIMTAYVGGEVNSLGTKLLISNLRNPSKFNLPANLATVILNDVETGELIALMEGASITAMRTAAVCAVATKYVARKDAETVGLFGAGLVGRELMLAIPTVRDIEKIRVFDLPELYDKTKLVCEEIGKELGLDAIAVKSPKEAIEDSDIVCTATTSPEPVFKGQWVEQGTHINSIGIAGGTAREIDDVTVKRARKPIVVDLKEHMIKEGLARDILIPLSENLLSKGDIIDLSDVVVGEKTGRLADDEITFFKSGGVAIQDVAAAKRVYDLAKKEKIGTTLQL